MNLTGQEYSKEQEWIQSNKTEDAAEAHLQHLQEDGVISAYPLKPLVEAVRSSQEAINNIAVGPWDRRETILRIEKEKKNLFDFYQDLRAQAFQDLEKAKKDNDELLKKERDRDIHTHIKKQVLYTEIRQRYDAMSSSEIEKRASEITKEPAVFTEYEMNLLMEKLRKAKSTNGLKNLEKWISSNNYRERTEEFSDSFGVYYRNEKADLSACNNGQVLIRKNGRPWAVNIAGILRTPPIVNRKS